ncbi:MAG: type phosphodiesterase/nucleotide pyrophosphatase [Gemmatimonadetes bacterium]|nr:type phosphodiesterase/nucleotide pyrophosphatase [Gemmatimonadota bacterium]
MNSRHLAALLLAAAPCVSGAQMPSPSDRPALVVLIAVDQLRGDYLDRFGSQLTGGLARFHDRAAYFPHAWQDHSNTETAPGHATMLSGREPVHTEIISNNRGVPDATAPLIAANGAGASPRRFNGTTLYDWMLVRDSSARVLSVSRKDRGAILPIGRAKGDVYWFADGKFTTSRYYADTLPAWVRDFDARIPYDRLANTRWDLLLPAAQYPEPDSVWAENGGADNTFPHTLPAADALRSGIQQYPWMDSLTLAFALDGVRATRVGKRSIESMMPNAMPDLLSISLSTTDAIGHAFGPDSREIHDQVLRVDRWLGQFFASLEQEVPASRIVYVLTGDHGIAPLPELAAARTGRGGRLWLGDIANATEAALEQRYHTEFSIEFDNGLMFGDVAAMHARGIDVDSIAHAIVAAGTARRGVSVGFTPTALATSSDSVAVRWRRTLPSNVGWIVAFGAAPDYVWSPGKTSAEHGTPNALDLSVPISFVGANVVTGRYEQLVRTVDIAPTLAMLIGVTPTEAIDGMALGDIVGRRSQIPLTCHASPCPSVTSPSPLRFSR